VFVQEYDPAVFEQIGERRAVVYTNLESGEQRLVFEGDDEKADALIRSARSQVVGNVFADVFGPPPRLLVFGAIDTAEALARSAKQLGWRTIVADARGRFATRERIPSADELIVAWPEDVLERVRPDHATAVVVLTHDEKFDTPAILGTLETDAFYIGALGSRRFSEEALERLYGPVGLDIGAHTPAETAVSMLAEIMAVRAGRDGGRLREASGRIHAEIA